MNGQTILLVDDELNMIAFLSELMNRYGYRPIVARNATEGIASTKREKPGCIIINALTMADEGISFYLHIKQDAETAGIPVILLSPVSRKTFNQYPRYKRALFEKEVSEPDAFVEIPLETNEIVKIVTRLAPNRTSAGDGSG